MAFSNRISKLSSKQIFFIDGIGAIVSAFFLGFVLVQFNSWCGMPINVLYTLSGLALIFALYSFTCYFLTPIMWRPYLKFIAFVNALYCLTTLGLVIWHYHLLTFLGICYFIIEIVIIALLVSVELRYAKNN